MIIFITVLTLYVIVCWVIGIVGFYILIRENDELACTFVSEFKTANIVRKTLSILAMAIYVLIKIPMYIYKKLYNWK